MKSSLIPSESGYTKGLEARFGVSVVESRNDPPFEESADTVPPHPLGLKPSGNQYTATHNSKRCVGPAFNILPDEVLAILLEYLGPKDLLALGSCCKFMYAFCRSEDLWKALFIE